MTDKPNAMPVQLYLFYHCLKKSPVSYNNWKEKEI